MAMLEIEHLELEKVSAFVALLKNLGYLGANSSGPHLVKATGKYRQYAYIIGARLEVPDDLLDELTNVALVTGVKERHYTADHEK